MKNFSREEPKARAFERVAYVLHGCWEEGGVGRANTRLFDSLVKREYVLCGTSIRGGEWSEHVVPCNELVNHSFALFREGRTVAEVAKFIAAHLKIARISRDEARRLDGELKLKYRMPDGWKIGDDVMARLKAAGIVLDESKRKPRSGRGAALPGAGGAV